MLANGHQKYGKYNYILNTVVIFFIKATKLILHFLKKKVGKLEVILWQIYKLFTTQNFGK